MEIHKQKTKKVTWEVTLNRLNQMLDFFGKNKKLSDFELRNGGRQLVIEMIKPMVKRGSVEQSSRCRRLLGQVFNHCEDRGWMEYGQNPSSRKTDEETIYDIDSYAHYLHHKYFECNYADGILPLDRWFGTLHDGSEKSFNKLRARLSKKNHKKIPAKTQA